jgi:hypothetical protein
VQRFIDDDDGYLAWLAAHQDLFVLNAARHPTPAYLMLHRASCHTINGTPTRGTRWTGDYIKIGGARGELVDYARREVGGHTQQCGTCG